MVADSAMPLIVEIVGSNPTRLWGLDITERTKRIARMLDLEFTRTPSTSPSSNRRLLVNAAYAVDPAWLRHAADTPGFVLRLGGVPVVAQADDSATVEAIRAAMAEGRPVELGGALDYEQQPTIMNRKLRKRETPFVLPLTPRTLREVERASYYGAYKGVTDVLTKFLWPELALVLTRLAARIGMTPNQVTAIGAVLCVAATFAFANGEYWLGMALGFVFMVLDTVDGKLARCTITSSWWGNVFDHGIDIVHPPFWWWFWGTGLVHWGLSFDDATFWQVQIAIQGGYVVQRLIEGAFIRLYGFHIHVWRRFDSQFRLITARRNPNMVILFVSLLFGRPDLGLVAVAWWTVASLAVHLGQLLHAMVVARGSGRLSSWLADPA